MPPSRARAMARVASVTVSMAEDSMGMLSVRSLVSLLRMSTSRGNTWEKAGNNSTSSNVSPSPKNFVGDFALRAGEIILAMCKDKAWGRYAPNFCPGVPERSEVRASAWSGVKSGDDWWRG